MKRFDKILLAISIFILCITIFNIYVYYKDVKQIQELNKEKLKLEIEILKLNKV